MQLELDDRIRQELLELYEKLNGAGQLLVGNELARYYKIFRSKFGPEQLRKLDGEMLLNAMHGPHKGSLAYWLEFKDDAEFPSGFGSIAGGSAFKFGLFRKKETGIWTTGSSQNPVELSLAQAIEKARQHRDQLLAGCELLAEMPADGDDEDYETLQQDMNRVAPDLSDTAWAHKYFSLTYPDKLDDYHVIYYQRFHLIKLLQIPPQTEGRYVAGGRYIAIANSLNMAVNTLSRVLNSQNSDPHLYWRIGTRGGHDKQEHWTKMRNGQYCAIGWSEDDDLSSITNDDAGRKALRAILQKSYPDRSPADIGKILRQVFDFRWSIAKGDLVLASDGATVLGVGRVTGDYIYKSNTDFPHHRPVEWLSLEPWQQPDQQPDIEGKLTTIHRMKRVANLIEAERQILAEKYGSGSNKENEKPPKLTWFEAIRRVLKEAGEPLTESEIASQALALGIQTQGKTPERTVNQVLNTNTDIFERVGKGLYRLRSRQTVTIKTFEDTKLAPILEPLLSRRIAELRRHLLVEETLVRRIYHALLNGHVIFTGPPGTGKTELARLIPEILWQGEEEGSETQQRTAYTTTLVTATNEWSTRTLISSIVPHVTASQVAYHTQHGHLTKAILRNWSVADHPTEHWEILGRQRPLGLSVLDQHTEYAYQGHWLIIDEFNRAPIDAALGEALTALSNGETLLVPIDGTLARLPLPQDFRIIGTLNSFDRNYLNLISEALKRRFAFIEVLPPTRVYQNAEQGIVLYKALKSLNHLSATVTINDGIVNWLDVVTIEADTEGNYASSWELSHPLYSLFHEVAWPLLEVLRIYRQLGTAQIITLVRQWLTPGILQDDKTTEQWLEALDIALCDTLADQLQVLLPDELEVLIWYLKLDANTFVERYNSFLGSLAGKQRRLTAHLEALSRIVNAEGEQLLSDEDIEELLEQEEPYIAPEILHEIFHLDHPAYRLPQFARRLRNYKAEHGL